MIANDKKLTFAFCTFNRGARLEKLLRAMRAQECPIYYEILAINNNSTDNTLEILKQLAKLPGPPLRVVNETTQGIVAARNRAIEEAIDSDILVFIDDDEIPMPGLIAAATANIINEGANCVGGRVYVDFTKLQRPKWLSDDLLGFLAEVNHGDQAFWITSAKTPIWTANIAYDMRIFRNEHSLRFDKRYDRIGNAIGGGEDVIMLSALLKQNYRIRYSPDMIVYHSIEPWRLSRGYFLNLHFVSGLKTGLYEIPLYQRHLFGIPLFLFPQLTRQIYYLLLLILQNKHYMRQAMNVSHTTGVIYGCLKKWIQNKKNGIFK